MNTWTLIVLLVGVTPPTGIVKYGFLTEGACWDEAYEYCDGQKKFRCTCTNRLPNPPRELPQEEP
jgi:hypothetical protein